MSEKNNDRDDVTRAALNLFLSEVQERQRQHLERLSGHTKIANEKANTLIPVRKMLKRLIDAGVRVTHGGLHDHGRMGGHGELPESVLLQVWEEEASPGWQPGRSLFLEHPASIEIAVVNDGPRGWGITMALASPHPDADMLAGKCLSAADACLALSRFLSASTVSVDDPASLAN